MIFTCETAGSGDEVVVLVICFTGLSSEIVMSISRKYEEG